MKQKIINYGIALLAFATVFLIAYFSENIFHFIESNHEHELLGVFFLTAIMFILSSIVYHVSRLTSLPSFVVAIFFGIIAHPFLEPIINNQGSLTVLVGLGATLILFSGGLETPFHSFKKLMLKIFALSFPGLLITAFLTSVSVYFFSSWFGFGLSIVTAVLLGAVLASTDPAAIIPILKNLKFKNRSIKDIIISESAFTDVTGTLLTVVFLSLIGQQLFFADISSWYGAVFSGASGLVIVKQLFFGILLGIIGYGLLELLLHSKKQVSGGHEADLSFFLFVPILIFIVAILFGGSGYLAAFIAGLLFYLTEHLRDTEHFFNNLVEGFLKPTIFILLGALVDIEKLIEYAPIGIAVALVFMFVIRPITVFSSLLLFKYFGKERLTINDMLFISFVRETGAIPAVLLVTIVSLNLPDVKGLVEIGMWVILCTLIIAPPLTPRLAKYLNVATDIDEEKELELSNTPEVMIVSRGYGFINRLPVVVNYVSKQNVNKVCVLLCLEEKYTEELESHIQTRANEEFKKINEKLTEEGKNKIDFRFISRRGFLQDNIDFISNQKDTYVTTIFAGKKILDYHLNEIKQLSIPIIFID